LFVSPLVFSRPCMQVCFENCVRRLKDDDPRLKVLKRHFLQCHFILKNASFYQDRLGTNIGKPLKKIDAFS
jgi:hypothetical protein